MFACPLLCDFCDLNNTAKLKDVNTDIDTVRTLIGTVCCVGIVWFEFAKIKRIETNLRVTEVANF